MSPQQASPQHVTGEGKAAYNLMFFIGVFFMLTLAAAGFIFVYTQLPKRVKRCSIDTLRNAQELILFVTDTQKIVLKPDAPQFKEIIAHFTELRRPAENNVFSEKLIVKTGAGTYTLEVSMEGWNFLGEQRNSRRLNNPMEFMQALYSLSKDGSG